MAATAPGITFGSHIKDGYKPVNAWVTHGITWLEDLQQFYRERSAIEKEYSQKLSALANRYYEKKNKKTGPLSVGDTPTLTPGSLESASLTIWGSQLASLEKRAAEHDRLGGEFTTQVADQLKALGARFDSLRKSYAEYNGKLEKERDNAYANLKKVKTSYDNSCSELEGRRKKAESSFDMNKSKTQNAYQNQIAEMHNAKNSYLISINVTNQQKAKYYNEYVPDLLDGLQDLAETRIGQVNKVWLLGARLEEESLVRSTDVMRNLAGEIPRNDPSLDCNMFLQHNVAKWQEPGDMGFEPSPIWHDDATMIVDDVAKIFLRNILGKSKQSRNDLRREMEYKREEVDRLKQIRRRIRAGEDDRDEVEVVRTMLQNKDSLHSSERDFLIAETETTTILSVVGDITVGAVNHNFKSETFKIPTNCDLCGERLWGLSAKGFHCRDCGYTCHSKCELKVPADCPGELSKEEKRKIKLERQSATSRPAQQGNSTGYNDTLPDMAEMPGISRRDTMGSLSSNVTGRSYGPEDGMNGSGQTRNRLLPAPAHELDSNGTGSRRHDTRARMLYAYQANGDGEVSVSEGTEVLVVEPDEGGWTTIRASGETGLVPTSYIEVLPPLPLPPSMALPSRPGSSYSATSSTTSLTQQSPTSAPGKKKGPAVAPRRGARKLNYVEVLYQYDATNAGELSMVPGERLVKIKDDTGDGWIDAEKGGKTGAVPASYVKDV